MGVEKSFLDEEDKIFEFDLTKDIKEGDQLFVIGKKIYIQPQVERTYSGFKMYGTPIEHELPLFTVNIDFEKMKVKAVIKGDAIPSRYRDEVGKILLENF